MSTEQLLSPRQVAARLGIDVRRVRAARERGQIAGWVRIGARWYLPRAVLNELLHMPAVTPIEPRPAVRFRA